MLFSSGYRLSRFPLGWYDNLTTEIGWTIATPAPIKRPHSNSNRPNPMRALDWLLLVFLSVLWGATFFFIAVASPEVPPFTLVLLRVAIAALALLPLVFLFGFRLPLTRAGWAPFVVQAIINNIIPFTLMVYGQQRIASGLAAVLNATTPLFTLLVARVLAGEKLDASKVAGVLLGVTGVGILVGPAALGANTSSVIGMLCILGGTLSYAFSALWMRRLRHIPPLVSSAAQLTCSSVMLLPMAALIDRFWLLPMPGAPAIFAVLALALFSTALAYIVFFRISATAGPANVMLVTLLIPVTATILGVLVLGEALTANQIAGALVIASGLIVIDGRLLGRFMRTQRA
jgi:drug/metabolite transporter (DMT)-like permease